jgi:hypothetical protein
MPGKIRNLLKSEEVRFQLRWIAILGIGAALIVVSTFIKQPAKEPEVSRATELLGKALSGVGEALAIAAVIAYLVDEAAKRKLLKEFAADVSEHIIGRILPEELREQMFQYLTLDFVRRDWRITYDLRLRPGTPSHVELVTTSEYVMENRSPLAKSFTVGYEVVEKWFAGLQPPDIRSVVVDGQAVYPNQGQTEMTVSAEGFLKLDSSKADRLTVLIPGRPDKKPPYKIDVKVVSAEYLGDTFYTSFDALHPVIGGTTVKARYDPRELEVALYLSFADNKDAEPQPPQNSQPDTWVVHRAILPGQGFLLRWRPS